ncbi:hypothetical protein GH721_10995 [Kriegella sp. EG-1]|nr:hypothetical protein [Flavobacteriaceae bacterium EG-1]
MKLTKEDILNIDKYLIKKGIKYIDIRYELIDHLVTEYESIENYPDLESFLRKRTAWCRIIAEKRANSIHWSYQKSLLKRVLSFFKTPPFYGVLLVWLSILISIKAEYGSVLMNNSMFWVFIGVVLFQYVDMIFWGIRSKKESKMLSISTLINIYSLPNIFMYVVGILESIFQTHPNCATLYFTIALIVNIAALIEVQTKRKRGLKEYEFLKSSMV